MIRFHWLRPSVKDQAATVGRSARPRRRPRTDTARRRGILETLEPRTLLSASAVADLFTIDLATILEDNVRPNDVADLTAPAALAYEVSADNATDQTWPEASGTTSFALALASSVQRQPATASDHPGISASYLFPGDGGATMPALQGFTDDPTTAAASFELWLRPDDLADADLLFETGSANHGLALTTDGANLHFTAVADGTSAGQLTAPVDGLLHTDEFNQLVATVEPTTGGMTLSLYLNGQSLASPTLAENLGDWADDDATGLAATAGSAAAPSAVTDFEGEIAAFRFYDGALSLENVRDHYSARAARVVASSFVFTELGGVTSVAADGSFSYDPSILPAAQNLEDGQSLTDRFDYTLDDGLGNRTSATVTIEINPTTPDEPEPQSEIDLAGRVFDDANNNGLHDTGEAGIEGATVRLFDESDNALLAEALTGPDGRYLFDADLGPGTYRIEQVQPDGFLDGSETTGDLGGTVDNTRYHNRIGQIVVPEGAPSDEIDGYNFAEIRPSEIGGQVWLDFNNDGRRNANESGIENVEIRLTGTNDRGQTVEHRLETDAEGAYRFTGLRPGQYTVHETQPDNLRDGLDIIGTVNGTPVGENTTNDQLSAIALHSPGAVGAGYSFAERPGFRGPPDNPGDRRGIGHWRNPPAQPPSHAAAQRFASLFDRHTTDHDTRHDRSRGPGNASAADRLDDVIDLLQHRGNTHHPLNFLQRLRRSIG